MQKKVMPIDPSTLRTLKCQCGNEYFAPVTVSKILPALHPANNQGQDQLIHITILKCANCGKNIEDAYKDQKFVDNYTKEKSNGEIIQN